MKKRKTYSSGFKTKVVLEALQERESIQEIDKEYDLHTNQISTMKGMILRKLTSYNLMLLFMILTASCAQKTRWIRNAKINDIEFEKLRYSCNDSDTISIIGFMKYNNEIQAYPCKKGWVHFTKERKLKLFCLGESSEVGSIKLPKGCWIIDAQDDVFTTVVFPGDTIIQGYPVRGGGGVKGARTRFYKSGEIKSFFPSRNFVINDTKFKKSLFQPVQISSEGSLTQD